MTDLMKKSTLSAQSAVRGSRRERAAGPDFSSAKKRGIVEPLKLMPILPKQTCSFAVAANLLDNDLFRAKESETKSSAFLTF